MSDAFKVKPSEIRALSPAGRSSLAAWVARVGDLEGDGDASIPKPRPFATTREDRDLPDERRQIVIRWEGGEYRSRALSDTEGWADRAAARKEDRAVSRVEVFVSTLTRPPKAAKGGCASRKATKAAPVVQLVAPVAPAPVPVSDRLVPRPIVRLARPAHMRRAVVVVKAPPPVEPVQIVTTIASAPPTAPAPVDLLALFWQTCQEGRA